MDNPPVIHLDASARKNEQLILRGLASRGQAPVAQALAVSESTVSRWKDGEIARWAQCLSVLGLRVVPVEYRCYEPKTLEALLTLARQRMDQLDSVEQLPWEEE